MADDIGAGLTIMESYATMGEKKSFASILESTQTAICYFRHWIEFLIEMKIWHCIVPAFTFHSNDKHTLCRLPGGIISCVYNFSVAERELRAWCMRPHQDWGASVVCWIWVSEANRCKGLSWVSANCGTLRTRGKLRRHILCREKSQLNLSQ